jgi:DNA invertase Pin-like site-specific DNA recombinase
MTAALYARVSTTDQTCENQLAELRRYASARGWSVREYVDTGVSGSKDSRPALDAMVRDARARRLDTVVVWRLDGLGRNLRHLILLLDELTAVGVGFVILDEGIDTGRRPVGSNCTSSARSQSSSASAFGNGCGQGLRGPGRRARGSVGLAVLCR